jgi:hypothetical protein
MSEDLGDCERGLRLQFRYIHNNQSQDLLSEQVRNIRVYIFDQNTGILVDIINAGAQDIARGYVDVNMPEGLYTVIGWGGSGNDVLQGGYIDATVTNPAANTFTPIVIGTTTLDNFRMMLAYDPLTGNPVANVTPKTADFDDLFYASVVNIAVAGWNRQVVNLDLIKNTSTLKVTVTGLQYLRSAMPVDIFTTGTNWLYTYNNTPAANTPRMLYLPQSETLTANNTVEASIKQQRIHINQSAVDQIMLYLRDPITNADIIAPLNVTAAIMQNPAYQTQAAIDIEDLFTITISIPPPTDGSVDITVTITINGWDVVLFTPSPV